MSSNGHAQVAGPNCVYDLGLALVDDHCAPSILMDAGKPPIGIWNYHGSQDYLTIRKGTTPLDLATLGAPSNISFAPEVNVSYQQVYRVPGTDTLFVVSRFGNTNNYWGFVKSTDYGTTWSAPQRLFSAAQQMYVTTTQVGNTLRIAAYGHPSISTIHDIFYYEADLITGVVTDTSGTTVANLSGTSLPLNLLTETPAIVNPDNSRLFEIGAGTVPEILFCRFSTDTDGRYKYARLVSGAFVIKDVAAVGFRFGGTLDNHYYGGMAWAEDSSLVLARRDASLKWWVEKYTTVDGGDNWTIEESFGPSGIPLARPSIPKGDPSTVVWNFVRSYTDYNSYIADTFIASDF